MTKKNGFVSNYPKVTWLVISCPILNDSHVMISFRHPDPVYHPIEILVVYRYPVTLWYFVT